MSTNNPHYYVENQSADIQKLVADGKLTGPTFIGQGLCKRVGSDCYGYYITGKKTAGKKTVWGISGADTVMHGSWTEGSEDCFIDMTKAKPEEWIVQSGWWKDKRTGEKICPKWFFCDKDGNKFNGRKCTYSWNGAYSYRDPSF